jgi:hypothetical protein
VRVEHRMIKKEGRRERERERKNKEEKVRNRRRVGFRMTEESGKIEKNRIGEKVQRKVDG